MKFCKNCGNQLSDNAKFCGRCGAPVAQQAPMNQGMSAGVMPNQMQGGRVMGTPSRIASLSTDDLLRLAQGVLAILTVLLGLFIPVVEAKSNGVSVALNMATIITFVGPLVGSVASALSTTLTLGGLSGSGGDMSGVAAAKDALGSFSIGITVINVLAIAALVGAFMTAARTLENTDKKTLITGWLPVPYLIGVLVLGGRISSSISDLKNVAGMASISSMASGLGEINVTIWPWIVLVLGIACGAVGVVRHLSTRPKQTFSAYPMNQTYPGQQPLR